jgi:hypothetical protein
VRVELGECACERWEEVSGTWCSAVGVEVCEGLLFDLFGSHGVQFVGDAELLEDENWFPGIGSHC